MKIQIVSFLVLMAAVVTYARYWDMFQFEDGGISRCEREGEDYCKCEKYFEGIEGQSCSKGRHHCDDSKSCYMNHPLHACCLDEEEEAATEADEPFESEIENNDEDELKSRDISRCEREGEDDCKCEKYLEGFPGQSCSKGRHNCDDSKSCYMNHPLHACCLDEEEEAATEADEPFEFEIENNDEDELKSRDISRCEREGEDDCKCEKYLEGFPGQSCSKGRHNCDDSKSCYMNHPWHACCLDEEEVATEAEVPTTESPEDVQEFE